MAVRTKGASMYKNSACSWHAGGAQELFSIMIIVIIIAYFRTEVPRGQWQLHSCILWMTNSL